MKLSGRCGLSVCLLLGLAVAPPLLAAEPTAKPLLRLETGMHTAAVNAIAVDAAERTLVTASADKTAASGISPAAGS